MKTPNKLPKGMIVPKLSSEMIFRVKVMVALGGYTFSQIAKDFGISNSKVVDIVHDKESWSDADIAKYIDAFRAQIVADFMKERKDDLSTRKDIISTGLQRLNKKILFDTELTASQLSDITSTQQKDLWTSIGQPTEITRQSQLTDEQLKELIDKIELNGIPKSIEQSNSILSIDPNSENNPLPATHPQDGGTELTSPQGGIGQPDSAQSD